MALAIFDLDNTLINGDSDHAWGEFLCEKGIVDVELYRRANDVFYQQYLNGNMDMQAFLAFALKPLKDHSVVQLQQWHSEFMAQKIQPMMQSKARQKLQQHRSQGDFILIITATNLFVTGPIAAALEVDDIIATAPEMIDGEYTGNYSGTPCFQEGKIVRLKQWLKQNPQQLEGSYFYSDSRNDLPLLELVDYPIAVDADQHLSQVAKQRNWPHISFRD
ncbi:MAG: HAD-IB family hydrolase [Pseudomonadales bacterium]|nr:HAD-IB family hydrolase [Pseudomonadales bacterium]NRA14858.1 HAD family hydrolase [Oceanospirillaceae bacterium]